MEEDTDFGAPSLKLASHPLFQRGRSGHRGILKIDTGLSVPVIGLGASAPTYYLAVGQRSKCKMILPSHSRMANVIRAIVGRVTMRASGCITSPSEGHYRVQLSDGVLDLIYEQEAPLTLEPAPCQSAQSAGAEGVKLDLSHDICKANVESIEMFVEAEVQIVASGPPRFANTV